MPPTSRSDSTRDRIVDAATIEFAQHGVAGARIDRLAKAAKTSKERVYAYFRGKEELYRYVFARELDAVSEATQMDAADLPGYAGRVHDYFVAHPDSRRLMRWGELEAADVDDASRETVARKAAIIADAQRRGVLDPSWNPLDVLVFVNQLATAWADQSTRDIVGDTDAQAAFLAERRAAVVAAVHTLFPASSGDAEVHRS